MNTASAGDAAAFRRALLDHFDRSRRALPWRENRTPYRVMVSEFMLQQTRVKTVVPYYQRWMRRFPDWHALAAAPLDDVILEWKGLGYYSRARNLHRSARLVRDRHGGHLPADPAALRTLPGVGDYTAGAIASIAFGHVVPAVDGNVKRVLARLLDVAALAPSRLREEAARLVDPERPGDFNEAMMELGATVCMPRAPRCGECPVARWCRARAAGTVAERPAPRPRKRVPRVEYATAVVVDAAGRTLLARRPPNGLLAGMWEFPAVEMAAAVPAAELATAAVSATDIPAAALAVVARALPPRSPRIHPPARDLPPGHPARHPAHPITHPTHPAIPRLGRPRPPRRMGASGRSAEDRRAPHAVARV